MRVRPGTAVIIGGLLGSVAVTLLGCGKLIGWVELTDDGLDVGAGGGSTNASSSGGGESSSSSGMGSGAGGTGTGGGGVGGVGGGGTSTTSSSSSSSSSSGVPPCFDCLEPTWLQSLNGMGDEVVNDIAVDSKGNVVFVGSINSSSNFADNCPALMTGSCPLNTLGGMDVFVVKVDPSGIPLWTIVAGDPNPTQEARSVAFGPNDAVFIAGNYDGKIAFPGGTILENPTLTTSNIFVAKYNADGTHGWSKGFGDEFKQVVGGIAVDSTGDVVVTGYFTNSIDFGCLDGMMMPNLLTSTGSNDIFVVKFRGTDGSCVWNRSFGDPKDQRAAAVDIDKNNDAIYFTGRCAGVFPVNSMMPTLDCGQSGMDVIVGKLDSMGEPIWGIRFGDTADQEGTSIAVAPDGKIAVTGRFFGTLDFGGGMSATAPGVFEDAFVVQLDSTGLATWARWFSSTGKQAGTSVAIGDNGQVFVAGEMTGSVQFGLKLLSATGTDAFVLAYDSLGNTICGNNYGDTDAQSGVAIASINTNEIVAGLNYQGTVDLDYTAQCLAPAPSATFQDALVGKFTLKP